ncbi:uncharacterized protein TRUGW13939_11229 [Talaromyces rugulosus]|uniref:Uncharacterized protein n=1 Tax=Talaromyces rugulosus TaxID=121627 RepID=A0A7H8RCP6_TALRU|nr:uncharacterized protein TRUGW13939_11229 [Talaromyces rugulosus]QKX64056.1 hypothetical protein TRUGW13939_11229 [Talaromyces rugulosus]
MADPMNIDSTTTTIMTSKFPMQARQGTTVRTGYMGTIQYKLEEFVYEEYDPKLHDITGVFHAQRVDTNSNEEVECTVKVRMQLNPALIGGQFTYLEYMQRYSPYDIKEESRILRACAFSGRTPKFLDSASEVQDHTGFFPGGYLHVLATSKLPGVPISRFLQGAWNLTENDLQVIKQDLVITINHIRSVGYTLTSEETTLTLNAANQLVVTENPLLIDENHIWYDRASQTVSFFDLSRFCHSSRRPYQQHYGYYIASNSNESSPRTEKALMGSELWKRLVAASQVARFAADQRSFQLCLRSRAEEPAPAAALRNNDDWQMVGAAAN